MIMESTLTCPQCGFKSTEIMPEDMCQFFYKCSQCETVIKAQPGDCCVFCSYGTAKCPSMQ